MGVCVEVHLQVLVHVYIVYTLLLSNSNLKALYLKIDGSSKQGIVSVCRPATASINVIIQS